MIKFNADNFHKGQFMIQCQSEHEAAQCVAFLYGEGFAWATITNFDSTVTQWEMSRYEGFNHQKSIFYYSSIDHGDHETCIFWADDPTDGNLAFMEVIPFSAFNITDVEISTKELFDLIYGG